jgi:cell fate (sporulation/competence/biofilm development) regulator YlbF (YheA/YmcA/DUF963 family)
MAVDTQQIMDEAEKLGRLVAQHPAIESYRKAQTAIAEDPEASRSLAEFDRQLESRIVSNIKVKALNMAQVEFMDLLRKVTQTVQKPLTEAAGGAGRSPQTS